MPPEEEKEEKEEEEINIWTAEEPMTVVDVFPDSPVLVNPRTGREETTFTGIIPQISTYDLDPGFDYITEYSPFGAEQRGQHYDDPYQNPFYDPWAFEDMRGGRR